MDVIGLDKIAHFLAETTITFGVLLFLFLCFGQTGKRIIIYSIFSFIFGMVIGFIKEFFDILDGRYLDWMDILADLIGCCVGLACFAIMLVLQRVIHYYCPNSLPHKKEVVKNV